MLRFSKIGDTFVRIVAFTADHTAPVILTSKPQFVSMHKFFTTGWLSAALELACDVHRPPFLASSQISKFWNCGESDPCCPVLGGYSVHDDDDGDVTVAKVVC
ncbi:hypothetical protein CCHOA_08225 [Corynebacterium choanae]|uniref:Uncharacterized protein n=1 Tax=Corynebacterium choanae TaxID=1862358 RepID=A0A3G6J7R9_9CORY|nr:hypothetical protein CCHOA_08225 [Corynebacterium choanae]